MGCGSSSTTTAVDPGSPPSPPEILPFQGDDTGRSVSGERTGSLASLRSGPGAGRNHVTAKGVLPPIQSQTQPAASSTTAASDPDDERQILSALRAEGLIQRSLTQTTLGASFELVEGTTAPVPRRLPARLSKLEQEGGRKRIADAAKIEEKLEKAKQRKRAELQKRQARIRALKVSERSTAMGHYPTPTDTPPGELNQADSHQHKPNSSDRLLPEPIAAIAVRTPSSNSVRSERESSATSPVYPPDRDASQAELGEGKKRFPVLAAITANPTANDVIDHDASVKDQNLQEKKSVEETSDQSDSDTDDSDSHNDSNSAAVPSTTYKRDGITPRARFYNDDVITSRPDSYATRDSDDVMPSRLISAEINSSAQFVRDDVRSSAPFVRDDVTAQSDDDVTYGVPRMDGYVDEMVARAQRRVDDLQGREGGPRGSPPREVGTRESPQKGDRWPNVQDSPPLSLSRAVSSSSSESESWTRLNRQQLNLMSELTSSCDSDVSGGK